MCCTGGEGQGGFRPIEHQKTEFWSRPLCICSVKKGYIQKYKQIYYWKITSFLTFASRSLILLGLVCMLRKYMALKTCINKGPDTTPVQGQWWWVAVVPSAQTNSWPPSFCSILKHVESIAKHQFSRKRCLRGRLAGRQLNVVCSHIQSLRQPISSHYRPLIRLSDELQ